MLTLFSTLLLASCGSPSLLSIVECERTLDAELDPDDPSHTGFSANDLLSLVDGLNGPIIWERPTDGYDSIEHISLAITLADGPVEAITRTVVDDRGLGCRGVEGTAIEPLVAVEASNLDGSFHAAGELRLVAANVNSFADVLADPTTDSMLVDRLPDDLTVAVNNIAAEHPGWDDASLYFAIEGFINEPDVGLDLRSGNSGVSMGDGVIVAE